MEGVVLLHEVVHELKVQKKDGLLLEIDFEKTYDTFKCPFLYQMLQAKGFRDVWCDWVMELVRGDKVVDKVNAQSGPYFPTFKGVRQGYPLSPLLCNIIVDGLAILVKRAHDHGLIFGMVPHLVNDGLVILQYAHDSIFLLEDDLAKAR
uniref:Reverse transcriptase domain-containing protein n=1 Tax=Aegilops tauschii subsp. strangulata TaxID=200361 RepID=A0A453M9N5_AEGTS